VLFCAFWGNLWLVLSVFGLKELVCTARRQELMGGSVNFGNRNFCDGRAENDPVVFPDRGIAMRIGPVEKNDYRGSNRCRNVHRAGVVRDKERQARLSRS